MKVLVVGGFGNIGSAVTAFLAKRFGEKNVYPASSSGLIYNRLTDFEKSAVDEAPYDFIIDCNGRPSRREARQNPREYFWRSLTSLMMWSGGVPHTNYIYISSCYANVYPHEWCQCLPSQLEPYGRTKLISEYILKEIESHLLILRPSLVIGDRMKKGVVFDLIENNRVFVKPHSSFNLITTRALAEIIVHTVEEWPFWEGKTYNVGSRDTIWVSDMARILGLSGVEYGWEYEEAFGNTDRLCADRGVILKTAEEYLKDFMNHDLPNFKQLRRTSERVEEPIQSV